MTLYGKEDEKVRGKDIVKSSMRSFEEQCHDAKEEHLALGTQEGGEIGILGTWVAQWAGTWKFSEIRFFSSP